MKLSLGILAITVAGAQAKCWCINNDAHSDHFTKEACRETRSLLIEKSDRTYCMKTGSQHAWHITCKVAGADSGKCD
ncbi:hypothetical protein CGRA01v4_14032 [Colletotrichum graminicola]|nr:hypothetical protein CGRA01v4_14032 [Colletotrichum graminicola]